MKVDKSITVMAQPTSIEIRAGVLRIFQEKLDKDSVRSSSLLVQELGCDELDLLEVLFAVDNALGIKLSDADALLISDKAEVVGEIVDFLVYKSGHSATVPSIVTKPKRLGPRPRAVGCGPAFGLTSEYCPVISVIALAVCFISFQLTSTFSGVQLSYWLLLPLMAVIVLIFCTVIYQAKITTRDALKEIQRDFQDGHDRSRETSRTKYPWMPAINTSMVAAIFIPAMLAALMAGLIYLDAPRSITWPLSFAYAAGFVGFLGFQYAKNRAVLLTSFIGATCLAKGALGATIQLRASTQDGGRSISFLWDTSSAVDVALIVAGTVLLLSVLVSSQRKETSSKVGPVA